MSPESSIKSVSAEPSAASPEQVEATGVRLASIHELAPHDREVIGFIDNIDSKRVSGWAWNRLRPTERLNIEIRLDGRSIATLQAERHRPDLQRVAIGDGNYGFLTTFEEPLPDHAKHRISAHAVFSDGQAEVELVNRTVQPARAAPRAEPAQAAARFEEWLEGQRRAQHQLQETLETALREISGAARGGDGERDVDVAKTLAEIRATQESVLKQLKIIETFQLRCDAALASISRKSAEPSAGAETASDRGLWLMVLALGVVSAISLGLGIYAIAF